MDILNKFIRKWHNKPLQDDVYFVSTEFNSFQNDFKKVMAAICSELGANLVNFNKGHYYVSGFVERNGNYVYFSYENMNGERATPDLRSENNMLCRTAKNERDYHGGANHITSFSKSKELIKRLLNK